MNQIILKVYRMNNLMPVISKKDKVMSVSLNANKPCLPSSHIHLCRADVKS